MQLAWHLPVYYYCCLLSVYHDRETCNLPGTACLLLLPTGLTTTTAATVCLPRWETCNLPGVRGHGVGRQDPSPLPQLVSNVKLSVLACLLFAVLVHSLGQAEGHQGQRIVLAQDLEMTCRQEACSHDTRNLCPAGNPSACRYYCVLAQEPVIKKAESHGMRDCAQQ